MKEGLDLRGFGTRGAFLERVCRVKRGLTVERTVY